MICKQILGNLDSFDPAGRTVEYVMIEWFETTRRIVHKNSQSGEEITIRRLNESVPLRPDDIIHADEKKLLVIGILACEALAIFPSGERELATACYEIGNKHLPLFFQDGKLLVPYDAPLHRNLSAASYSTSRIEAVLTEPLKTTVLPHGNGLGLLSKILQLSKQDNHD
jgi:urease accessory protein